MPAKAEGFIEGLPAVQWLLVKRKVSLSDLSAMEGIIFPQVLRSIGHGRESLFLSCSVVSVPHSSLSMVVTVKCGHCTSLLSVNMLRASFAPLHLSPSLSHSDHHPEQEMEKEIFPEITKDSQKEMNNSSPVISSDEEGDYVFSSNLVINRPPEKRPRAPSAYNRFIKDEIRRLKAKNPNMAHKQAFSTAAKNWAHFPPSLNKLGDEDAAAGNKTHFHARSM
ncbi:axial regulator YABBY 4 isoform X1 [Daucus carota subsp. sativus]|uniref:axial regulator YABBY 4 isoform X1 n=1 Tax=Daucus carota subsp. sativus TaxID=79200 RepID=UPI0007EF4704|nr:PREDICTED: axial regulator YABBY 4 isoform X1 [Daucus carota subsp. sativus]